MCAALIVGLEGVLQAVANTRSLARAGRMVGALTEGHIARTLKPPGADSHAGWRGIGCSRQRLHPMPIRISHCHYISSGSGSGSDLGLSCPQQGLYFQQNKFIVVGLVGVA